MACGTPEEVAACPHSYTGQYLKKMLPALQKWKNRTKQAFLPVSSCFDIVSKTTTICAGGNEKAFASSNECNEITNR